MKENIKKENVMPVDYKPDFYKNLVKAIKQAPVIYYRKLNHYIHFNVMYENHLIEIARLNQRTWYLTLKVLIDPDTLLVIYDLLEKLGYKYEFLENELEETE